MVGEANQEEVGASAAYVRCGAEGDRMIVIPIWRRVDLVIVRADRCGRRQTGAPNRDWHPITRVFLNYVGRHAIVVCPGYGLQWVGGGGSCAFIWTHLTALRLRWSLGIRESRKTDPTACFPREYRQACGDRW